MHHAKFLIFQFVASTPVLKAPWITCKPQLPIFIKAGKCLLLFWWHYWKISNWQVDHPLIFDTFLIDPTPPYTFQTLSKSAAVPWPKYFEFQYWDSTRFFDSLKKHITISISQVCVTGFKLSSKQATKQHDFFYIFIK